jgi:hypothetical protein
MAENMVEFNAESFKKFKQVYAGALLNNDTKFVFEGNEYLVSYAKYLIEYLEPKFKK